MTLAALTILNLAAMFTYRHTGGRYVTDNPRTKLGTQNELRALFSLRYRRTGMAASRVIRYLNALPPADPRAR